MISPMSRKKIAARVAIWLALIRSRLSNPQLERMTIPARLRSSLHDHIYADANIMATTAASLDLDV